MIPSKEDFPYSIRVVSECLGSGGSTSMGSVCGSTLALMDAGVPLKKPVAGIAMGLMTETDENGAVTKHMVLNDLMATEDFTGDMDFKVAGTKKESMQFSLIPSSKVFHSISYMKLLIELVLDTRRLWTLCSKPSPNQEHKLKNMLQKSMSSLSNLKKSKMLSERVEK